MISMQCEGLSHRSDRKHYANENYDRIAQAIGFMRQHYRKQPDLATIAEHIGLSPSHFQRLFTQWAGISPKRFLQYLTLEYAKSKITQTQSLLALTFEVGLSSPGRLHDLFVNLEAMSPGEFKAEGAGLQIHYAIHQSPFGQVLIATTPRGICNVQFLNIAEQTIAEQMLRQCWPKAEIMQDRQRTKPLYDLIFSSLSNPQKPLTSPLTLNLFVKGTNFQIQVWRALLNIPFGGMTTYQNIAKTMGHPTSARAVGNAIGNNPISYLIPCHRVIRASGELGGYRWGLERKTAILGWEASQITQKSQALQKNRFEDDRFPDD